MPRSMQRSCCAAKHSFQKALPLPRVSACVHNKMCIALDLQAKGGESDDTFIVPFEELREKQFGCGALNARLGRHGGESRMRLRTDACGCFFFGNVC